MQVIAAVAEFARDLGNADTSNQSVRDCYSLLGAEDWWSAKAFPAAVARIIPDCVRSISRSLSNSKQLAKQYCEQGIHINS